MTQIDKEIRLLKWIAVLALAVIVAVLHTLVIVLLGGHSEEIFYVLGQLHRLWPP